MLPTLALTAVYLPTAAASVVLEYILWETPFSRVGLRADCKLQWLTIDGLGLAG